MTTMHAPFRSAALLACAIASSAHAQIWIEPRISDAGAFVPGAQETTGVGPLTAIVGQLDGAADLGLPDIQDMYAIFVSDPANFSATTVAVGGGADFNTNLWLFNANARGRLGNRDFQLGSDFSRLLPVADDGTFTLTAPGIYYLAITGGVGHRPLGSNGEAIFDFATALELSGPDGGGASFAHNAWALGAPEIGTYRIELTGVSYIPAPGSAGAILLAATLAARRRRR